jgi:hypothetical protein
MYWSEYCSKVFSRKGTMVPVEQLHKLTGFRSVYLFTQNDAQCIKKSNSSSGMTKYEVFSNELFLDFDGDDALLKADNVFRACQDYHDFSTTMWFSGSKGYHIVIKIQDMFGLDVPYSQKLFVQNAFGKDYCDESIYKHSGLIRLPNTVHQKTGKRKVLVKEHKGSNILEIPYVDKPIQENFNNVEYTPSTVVFLELIRLMEKDVGIGQRHMSMFTLAGMLAGVGYKYETILDILENLNASFEEPKSKTEVEIAVQGGFDKPIFFEK